MGDGIQMHGAYATHTHSFVRFFFFFGLFLQSVTPAFAANISPP